MPPSSSASSSTTAARRPPPQPVQHVFINYSDPARERKDRLHRHVVTTVATLHACRTRRPPAPKRKKEGASLAAGHGKPKAKAKVKKAPMTKTSPSRSTSPFSSSTASTTQQQFLQRDLPPSPPPTSDHWDPEQESGDGDILRDISDQQSWQWQQRIHETDDEPWTSDAQLVPCSRRPNFQSGTPWLGQLPLSFTETPDPFDSLPGRADRKTWSLLAGWLSAGRWGEPKFDGGAGSGIDVEDFEGYRAQTALVRRQWFWPVVTRNRATFGAAVAWIATSTEDKADTQIAWQGLSASLPALRESLDKPTADTAESAWYTIILLLAVSVRVGHATATRYHYRGLAALLSLRPELFVAPDQVENTFTASFLYTFVGGVILSNYNGPRWMAQAAARGQSDGFARLQREGAIGPFLTELATHVAPLQALAAQARRRRLTPSDAAHLLNSVWCCQLGLYVPEPVSSELENLIWIGIAGYWYVERCSRQAAADTALALHRRLTRARTARSVRRSHPDTVFWLAMTAGPLLQRGCSAAAVAPLLGDEDAGSVMIGMHQAVEDLQRLIAALAREIRITTWTVARTVLQHYLWSELLDGDAQEFWTGAMALRNALDDEQLAEFAMDNEVYHISQAAAISPLETDEEDNDADDNDGGNDHGDGDGGDGADDAMGRRGSLPYQCQFCRRTVERGRRGSRCACATGQADPRGCPSHLRGSLWPVPPSVWGAFCGPVWAPRRSAELPRSAREVVARGGGGGW